MSESTIAEQYQAMTDSSPPPPPPGSPVKITLLPELPLKLSPAKHHRVGVSGVGANTTTSKDNSTDASSSSSFSHDDINNNNSASSLLSPPLLVEIEEGTPAAEALKANADVRVSKLRKVGRSVRVLKSASRTSRVGSGAHVRSRSLASIDQTPPAILEVEDEGGSDHGADGDVERHDSDENQVVSTSHDNAIDQSTQIIDADSDKEIPPNSMLGTPSPSTDRVHQSSATSSSSASPVESALATQYSAQSRSKQKTPPATVAAANRTGEGDADDDKDKQLHTPPNNAPIESLLLAQHPVQRLSGQFTHLASSAAVAAACLAGEEMDRKRAAHINELTHSSEGMVESADAAAGHNAHKSPLKQPFTHLFKGNANMSEMGSIDDSAVQIRRSPRPSLLRKRACSVSEGIGQVPLLPRGASTGSSSPAIALLKSAIEPIPPSEISIAETVLHANVNRVHDVNPAVDDLSDDGNDVLLAGKLSDDTVQSQSEKQISFNPIIVEIPGSATRQFTIEESKEEEEEIHALSDNEREADHHKALMTKARKKLSRITSKKKVVIHDDVDDDSFYFHGPKSVRKWVQRRRSIEESKDMRSYVKGKVIDGKHELYTMSIAVMFGMRTSIGRTNLAMSQTAHNSRRWLDTDHLMAVEKYEFPPRVSITDQLCAPYQYDHIINHVCSLPIIDIYVGK